MLIFNTLIIEGAVKEHFNKHGKTYKKLASGALAGAAAIGGLVTLHINY